MVHLKPRSVTTLIYQGDDYDTLRDLRRRLDIAERAEQEAGAAAGTARLGDDEASEVETARADYDSFVDEAAGRALEVRLQAIGRRRFRDLLLAHPPRTETVQQERKVGEESAPAPVEVVHPDDGAFSVNTETFPMALLTYIDIDDPARRTIAAPEFTSPATTRAFLDDELEDGDFDGLWVAAYYLNRTPSADPSRSGRSPRSQSSDATAR